ncbi:MAG: MAPEG family protein [Phenylobacterium sp.]|nr:MAG: MAPEG family protein [Phenylobacterium sp.]
MTLPLWMLLAFAGWTLLVLLIGVGVRRWSLILTGRAELSSFPGDTPHGSEAYRRAVRAHANCVENLPVFAAIVLTAAAARLAPPNFGALAAATVIARVAQSAIHMLLPASNPIVAARFSCFLIQVIAMIAMGVLVVLAALRG